MSESEMYGLYGYQFHKKARMLSVTKFNLRAHIAKTKGIQIQAVRGMQQHTRKP